MMPSRTKAQLKRAGSSGSCPPPRGHRGNGWFTGRQTGRPGPLPGFPRGVRLKPAPRPADFPDYRDTVALADPGARPAGVRFRPGWRGPGPRISATRLPRKTACSGSGVGPGRAQTTPRVTGRLRAFRAIHTRAPTGLHDRLDCPEAALARFACTPGSDKLK